MGGGIATESKNPNGNTSNNIDVRRSYEQVVSEDMQGAIPLRSGTIPNLVGGNIAVTIDKDEYVKGLENFNRCLIGRHVLVKGDEPITMTKLKKKFHQFGRLMKLHGSYLR